MLSAALVNFNDARSNILYSHHWLKVSNRRIWAGESQAAVHSSITTSCATKYRSAPRFVGLRKAVFAGDSQATVWNHLYSMKSQRQLFSSVSESFHSFLTTDLVTRYSFFELSALCNFLRLFEMQFGVPSSRHSLSSLNMRNATRISY